VDTFTEEGITHQERMKMIHQSITKDLEWSRLQQKEYYDRRRVEAPSLEEGDRVYLRRTTGEKKFNIKTLRTSTKLDHLKLGPFTIKKKLDFDNEITSKNENSPCILYIIAGQNGKRRNKRKH